MTRSTVFRRAAIVLASAAAFGMLSSGPASAAPVADFAKGAAELQALATEVSPPAATAAMDALLGASVFIPKDVLEVGLTTPQDFMYPSPTLGCGVADKPATVTLASAQGGPNLFPPRSPRTNSDSRPSPPTWRSRSRPTSASPGSTSRRSRAGSSSSTTSFRSSIPPLLSKIVDTGKGTVLATMFGTVGYADSVTCTVVPTVGTFTV